LPSAFGGIRDLIFLENQIMPKVMIAENDLLMADMLEESLLDAGYEVCGIVCSVEEGVALGELHKPDFAVLDLRLNDGGLGTEIAAQLDREGGLGILYATGNAGQIGLSKEDGDACLNKPYRPTDVVRALKIVGEVVSTGKATQPFPGGFRLLESSPIGKAKRSKKDTASQDQELNIARLLRQQAALAAFGTFALGESDLGTVLTEAAHVCADSFAVPFSKVCRYRSEQNDLLVEAGAGWKPGVIGCVVSRADRSSPQGRAFITGRPVICADISKDASFLLPSFYAEHGIVSTLDVVIKKKAGQPWGVLEIDNPNQHVYDQHDVNFVTGFANVLAEAVNTSKRNAVVLGALEQMKDMVADRDRLLTAQSQLLSEKSVLAQELQHRIRNNLQLVYGMLSQHTKAALAGSEKPSVGAIARRVLALAKVYDHLLGTGLTRTIDFGRYLSALCDAFKDVENTQDGNVVLTCHGKSLLLDLDTATPLGLAVSELIANSYLHAFPEGYGTITVSLVGGDTENEGRIDFVDDGVGFKSNGESKRHGLGLVKRLMEQIGGSAEVLSDHGTAWALRFPAPKLLPEIDGRRHAREIVAGSNGQRLTH
jgi:two-component sensor histidine kinase/ActR/RegA family two-component response regulator